MERERFSVEEYLKNPSRKVVTGQGKGARIVCTDVRSVYPVVAAVDECEIEGISTYTAGGRFYDGKEDQRDLYFAAVTERFDPNGLRPFDRVLVRDGDDEYWEPSHFGYPRAGLQGVHTVEGNCWKMCIPYNDETARLLGTDNDCPDKYKWWED